MVSQGSFYFDEVNFLTEMITVKFTTGIPNAFLCRFCGATLEAKECSQGCII